MIDVDCASYLTFIGFDQEKSKPGTRLEHDIMYKVEQDLEPMVRRVLGKSIHLVLSVNF